MDMIDFKFSSTQPTDLMTSVSPCGEYTRWIDVRGLSYIDASILIGKHTGFNTDTDIVITALEYGFLGVHHTGYADIARGWAEHEHEIEVEREKYKR
jgi:hypothetical protein